MKQADLKQVGKGCSVASVTEKMSARSQSKRLLILRQLEMQTS